MTQTSTDNSKTSEPTFWLSASLIKEWFQYRCERKAVYRALGRKPGALPAATVPEDDAWREFGEDTERRFVEELRAKTPVLVPEGEHHYISDEETDAFLSTSHEGVRYAHGLSIIVNSNALRTWRARFGLPERVRLSAGHPDLTLWEDGGFVLIDIKATHVPRPFHRAQIAFYALMLQSKLQALGSNAKIMDEAEIWHLGAGGTLVKDRFELQGYVALVEDFLWRDLPRLLQHRVNEDEDTTNNRFHLYFKCEQCSFLSRCKQSVQAENVADCDISAIAGLTQRTKYALADAGYGTVGALSGHDESFRAHASNWMIRAHGSLILERANALVAGEPRRIQNQSTLRLGPRVDRPLYFVAEHDPMRGRLCAVGCYDPEAMPPRHFIGLVGAAEQEGVVLARMLTFLKESLDEIDAYNHSTKNEEDALQTHILAYEPSEIRDLSLAIARHLANPVLRGDLVHLVRIFPPEQVLAEPDYRGYHHMPASSLRTVLEEVYAVPARVSYDLARVTQSLKDAYENISHVYRPESSFTREFSSKLPLSWAQRISDDAEAAYGEVAHDIFARLQAMHGLTRWLQARNERCPPQDKFLHLHKRPFSYRSSFDPFEEGALGVLQAQVELRRRMAVLQALNKLAYPAYRRRDSYVCYAGLELIGAPELVGERGHRLLKFRVPSASREAEIHPGDFSLILTDGAPERLLNPGVWPDFRARLLEEGTNESVICVRVERSVFESDAFQELLAAKPEQWFLDRALFDSTTDTLLSYLKYIAKADDGGVH